MPPEWSPHQATWISWPHNTDTWASSVLEAARDAMTAAVVALAGQERVFINVQDEAMAEAVERRLAGRVPPERVSLERIPTDDAWVRDYGAIIVRDPESPVGFAACDFDYNAWGGKYPPFDRDQAVAKRMAERLGLPRLVCDLILEGGSVEVNGEGFGLVTEQCLLNPNRNPGRTRAEIEAVLGEFLGLDEVLWLGEGVVGDDTDGHIDNLARFFGTHRVLTIVEPDPADPNHAALADNLARLRKFRDRHGRRLEVVELPVPAAVMHGGTRLPASYANFYIANELVLMPVFGGANDDAARGILAACFPGRRIVPIDCRALIVGLGSLHCLTQQIPVIVEG
jgi:agmatine deiminase